MSALGITKGLEFTDWVKHRDHLRARADFIDGYHDGRMNYSNNRATYLPYTADYAVGVLDRLETGKTSYLHYHAETEFLIWHEKQKEE